MARYIELDALVAKMERKKNLREEIALDLRNQEYKDYFQGKAEAYKETIDLLDTLEVREVDDEPECKIFPRPIECYSNCKECPWLATNNKAQKEEV